MPFAKVLLLHPRSYNDHHAYGHHKKKERAGQPIRKATPGMKQQHPANTGENAADGKRIFVWKSDS